MLNESMTPAVRTRLAIATLIALLRGFVQQANAQGAIVIQSASATANQTALNISGSNFCASPTVTLGGNSLAVPVITPGTYYLVVSCGTLAVTDSGAGDWRLPTRAEWLATIQGLEPAYAYLVDLSLSNVSTATTIVPHFQVAPLTLHVWPVRNGSK